MSALADIEGLMLSGIIFFSDVASRVDPSVPTVFVGDFNTVFDRAIDRMGCLVGDVSRESSWSSL